MTTSEGFSFPVELTYAVLENGMIVFLIIFKINTLPKDILFSLNFGLGLMKESLLRLYSFCASTTTNAIRDDFSSEQSACIFSFSFLVKNRKENRMDKIKTCGWVCILPVVFSCNIWKCSTRTRIIKENLEMKLKMEIKTDESPSIGSNDDQSHIFFEKLSSFRWSIS